MVNNYDYCMYGSSRVVRKAPTVVKAICLECETHLYKCESLSAHNCTFGLLYGMSAYTMSDRIHESIDDTKLIIDKYWKAVPEIPSYQNAVIRKGRKKGTIYTYFGLPRRVSHYLESSNNKMRKFGERTCSNTMIQGTCSTITLIAFIKMYKKLYSDPNWKDDCHFFSYIHDEIVSSVKKERVEEFVKIQQECMEMTFPGLPLPYRTSVSLGTRWGNEVDFVWEDGHLRPDWEEVKE